MELVPSLLVEPLPGIAWIELTSRCPFDCVFCSRRLRRGDGEHMAFPLFQSLIAQLENLHLIRLNYSGESIHYPYLIEAIELAAATGASTEIVTAFASVQPALLAPLARSGLGRLSISLHSLDERQFQEIYGYSSLNQLQRRLEEFLSHCASVASPPVVDFAFVAMDGNLAQLRPLARFAEECGVKSISVLPVLRRDPILVQFPSEQQPDFRLKLRECVARAAAEFPALTFHGPPEEAGDPPPGATIRTCEQNPWDTIHVLSNGDVVACEVHDKTPLGNLKRESLRQIWQGAAYRRFRRQYLRAELPECRGCRWKTVYASGKPTELLRGWYEPSGRDVTWSRPRSSALLCRPAASNRLRIAGVLPHSPLPGGNALLIRHEGEHVATIPNRAAEPVPFDVTLPLGPAAPGHSQLSFEVRHAFCPRKQKWNEDGRTLGFALASLEFLRHDPPSGIRKLSLYPAVLTALLLRRARRLRAVAPTWSPGLSIVIPERDNPVLLARCLESALKDLADLHEPSQIIVVVNGSPESTYAGYRTLPVEWIFSDAPMSFSAAIREGLRLARHDWVYLLNNDMVLRPGSLGNALELRAPDVFSVASQIFLEDPDQPRVESNWTGSVIEEGILRIIDRVPGHGDTEVREHLYAGGGSSLFRTELLRQAIAFSGAYEPFYWEDVEWGTLASRAGYRNLFCPASRVVHTRRATIGKFHSPAEIERIFRRNGLLYQLRNRVEGGSHLQLFRAILREDSNTFREILMGAARG